MKEYRFPNLGEYQKPAEELLGRCRPIVLYGFNEAGKKTYEVLKSRNISVSLILDLFQADKLKEYEGIPVVSPERFTQYNREALYLICSNRYFEEMRDTLYGYGCGNVLPYYAVYCNRRFSYEEFRDVYQIAQRADDNRKIAEMSLENSCLIDTIDVVITEKCSLKCRNCSNLMQYFKEPKNAEIDDVLEEVSCLLDSVDYIHEIRILGGEPFANPKWHEYVHPLLKYNNFGCIIIYTNGTILPKPEQMEVFRDKRVFLSISDYGEVSRRKEELVNFMCEKEYFYSIAKVTEWTDCGRIAYCARSDEELEKMYHECCMSGCLSLKDKKIFACPFAGNLLALGAIPEEESEYISISPDMGKDETRRVLKEFQQKKYIRACQYCMGRPIGTKTIPAAEQCSEPLDYQRKDM